MPYGDRTGPLGQGPKTGRGLGYCSGNDRPGADTDAPRRGMGRGTGFGRGGGRGMGRGMGRGFGRGMGRGNFNNNE
ncbi:DUF5320 domain-containing protein [Thermotomaculum hydrothermale]|uniref:DUF5320 domain-containing protein n=1 Tax=Thermotomaculum hydrothermale TaxID=981385 RepID=UPI001915E2B9|nr:DUF5320 domain-containing protein [Thermotomaculum hydrothermale]